MHLSRGVLKCCSAKKRSGKKKSGKKRSGKKRNGENSRISRLPLFLFNWSIEFLIILS